MQTWVTLPPLPTSRLGKVAELAEQVGVNGLAVSDHVCVPAQLDSEYPYTGKTAVLPQETEFPDPMAVIASLGARTSSIRFMTYVLLVPLRHPVLLAKDVVTTALLTGNRVDLGAGVGWMREEFDALDVPFESRGSRLDESLQLLRQLMTGEPVEHHGMHFDQGRLTIGLRPSAPIPMLVGGHSPPALRRAARYGDGWVGVNPTIEELHGILDRLHDERKAAGTQDRPFEVRTGVKGRLEPDQLDALVKLGVDALLVAPWQLVPRGVDMSVEAVLEALPSLLDRVQASSSESGGQ